MSMIPVNVVWKAGRPSHPASLCRATTRSCRRRATAQLRQADVLCVDGRRHSVTLSNAITTRRPQKLGLRLVPSAAARCRSEHRTSGLGTPRMIDIVLVD